MIHTNPGPRRLLLALAIAIFTTGSTALAAQWEGTVGTGAVYTPDYPGSDDYEWTPFPAFEATYNDTLFVSIRNGIGWNVINQNDWQLAPFIGYTFGRDDTGDINDLDKIKGGATAGLRIGYQGDSWLYTASAETPFTGDVDGYRLAARAIYVTRPSERTVVTFGSTIAYASADRTASLFRVSPGESARSGINAYDPDDGHFSFGANASLSYYLTPQWSVTGLLGVSRLTGEASDSPIVSDLGSSTQWRTGALINYHF